MEVVTAETVSRSILSFRYCDAPLTALLIDLVKPGDHVVDIGTHLGYEAMLMAELVGSHGSVHAFEPNSEIAAIARRNLAATPWVQLDISAVGESACSSEFTIPPITLSSLGGIGGTFARNRQIVVDVKTLDQIHREKPDAFSLIKCDAEGHDAGIVRGGVRVLSKVRPALILETGMPNALGQSARTASELETFLEPFGYRAFGFEFDGSLRISNLASSRSGHANTLYLPNTHRRYGTYCAAC